MAYADTNSTNRKLGAGAAVLAIEAGLAWAIITGLAMTITRTKPPNITTLVIPPDAPVKPTVPQPQPSTQPEQRAPRPQIEQTFVLGPSALPTFVAGDSLGSGGNDAIEIPRVTPSPVPAPSFTPKSARPRGKTGNWVTTNDYPTSDLRQEHEGSTRYRLSIDASGKVNNCTVVASSGFAGLDQAACANLSRRGQFEPATDETGARAPGSYSGTVTWRLPQD